MKTWPLALGVIVGVGCPTPAPVLPGQFLGSFAFTGQMVPGDGDGGGTTCLVDGGALAYPATVQFYAALSLLDAGALVWQLQNAPAVIASVSGTTFSEVTSTSALVSGCNCTALLVETITLTAGAGLVPGVSLIQGFIDDRLDPNDAADAGAVCGSEDAGGGYDAGCGLKCDLIY